MTRCKRLRRLLPAVLLLAAVLLAGCPGRAEPAPAYIRVTEPTLRPGEPIPLPVTEPIVTVTGKIGTSNQDGKIIMDRATVETVGLVDYTVLDPFKNVDVTYRGVLMQDMLDVWQVAEDATALEVLALNDYRAEVPIEQLRNYPVIYALQADGAYMPVDDKGPAMLVYPYNEFEFERPLTDAFWVWQIEEIHVK